MAAERMDGEKGGAVVGGLESMMGDLEGMDLGALMKDLDPNTLQELVQEGMKEAELLLHLLPPIILELKIVALRNSPHANVE